MTPTGTAAATELVIDTGNTRSKLGLFDGDRLVRAGAAPNGDADALRMWLAGAVPRRVVIGSVAASDSWAGRLQAIAPVRTVSGDALSPLRNRYTTPTTLGVDRLANAVAAQGMCPGRPVLAIALGTCVIYDLVTAQGDYLGGAISPGMRMRSHAMHAFSARLPETDLAVRVPDIGDSTQASLLAGIHHGIVHELNGWIARLRQQHERLAVVLTGGDAPRFARALKSGIFADPSLTLKGLHALASYADHHHSAPVRSADV